jgi:crossover junction endodeoxyribonuclease RusA
LKATLDALTHAGVWEDDSQIDALTITRAPLVGGMLKVRIEVIS